MAVNPKDIYRGHRHVRTAVIVCATVFLALLITAVILFYSLQKFIVVTPEGVRLALPYMENQAAGASPEISGSIPESVPDDPLVFEPPDYSGAAFSAGQGLIPLRALSVQAKDVTAEKLMALADTLDGAGANALAIEMKPESGQLVWKSLSPPAYAYGTTGNQELGDALAALKERGVYLVARVACCADSLMASRNTPLQLKTVSGLSYKYGGVSWTDPFNRELRTYIFSLADELYAMGFDEILLTELDYPAAGEFAGGNASGLSAENAINNFARALRQRFEGGAPKLSLLINGGQLRGQSAEFIGQNPTVLAAFFDRICVETSPDTLLSDKELACAGMGGSDTAMRFVKVTASPEGTECWIMAG